MINTTIGEIDFRDFDAIQAIEAKADLKAVEGKIKPTLEFLESVAGYLAAAKGQGYRSERK